jgi:hypothetical protein
VTTKLRQNIVLSRSRKLRARSSQVDCMKVGFMTRSTLTLPSGAKCIIVNRKSSCSCLIVLLRLPFTIWNNWLRLDLLNTYVTLLHIFFNMVGLKTLKAFMQQESPAGSAESLLNMILFRFGTHNQICSWPKVRIRPRLLVFGKG